MREEQWNDVAIFHHAGHTANLDRMLRTVRASLDYYSEQFGPYPYSHIRLIEHPGHGRGLHAEAMTIDFEESTRGSRMFAPSSDAWRVVVINETAARRLFRGKDP